ncbi:Cystathionine beta-lyase family protein involved in aluminum resistance [Ruminococcaceae bacterium YRB3002]|nr:Cystathionine beta-lyase family protein involved in aluminum resistance [Ruminococcaceae bacterium YRB3002]
MGIDFTRFTRYGVSPEIAKIGAECEEELAEVYAGIDEVASVNELKILDAFRQAKFSDVHMGTTTGHGYDDIGREKIEEIFAKVFGFEKAYVRVQISSGTQAISAMLFGILRPGDEMLSVTGKPYDTLAATIGIGEGEHDGSLKQYGITYRDCDLKADGSPDIDKIVSLINANTRMVFIQKSRGYTARRALLADDIRKIAEAAHAKKSDVIVAVDNCYGEFCETAEPGNLGCDICAGSLIKNPGGGICYTGAYIAGREELVEKCARHLTTPGLGSEVGPTLGFNRMIARGLFTAPQCVAECLKGAAFAAAILEKTGYAETSPAAGEKRGDIVQTLIFNDEERMKDFIGKIQACSPVDSFVTPEPWDMPGYEDKVIMAAGAFVQGATTELSCDGPIKPPYIAYLQGGLVADQAKLAVMLTLS